MSTLYPDFRALTVEASGATIHLETGGHGAPLLLLHGYPQTHAMWHRVAPVLARDFTVVAPDLRGYGDSGKPPGGDDHAGYSKRTMALDQVQVMRQLGFERFAVAGHDRGARVAYRLALDHPQAVTRLALLDIVPIHTMFSNVDRAMAWNTFHWFFLSQPYDLPEHLIGGDPAYFLHTMLARWSGGGLDVFSPEALAEYVRCFSDPATIYGSCEDYRAGATIDFENDSADYGRRRIGCPLLVLWAERGGASRRGSPLEVWREWAEDVRGQALECGRLLPEERPQEVGTLLGDFFRGG